MNVCRFCEIVKGAAFAHVIWQNKDFLAMLAVSTDSPGSSVVMPKQHFENVFALPEPLYSNYCQAVKNLYAPLKEALSVNGVAVSFGTVGCGHVHINLFPNNGEVQRHSTSSAEVTDEECAEIAQRIRDVITAKRSV